MSQAQLTGFFSVQKRGHASAENPHPHKRDRQDMLTGLSEKEVVTVVKSTGEKHVEFPDSPPVAQEGAAVTEPVAPSSPHAAAATGPSEDSPELKKQRQASTESGEDEEGVVNSVGGKEDLSEEENGEEAGMSGREASFSPEGPSETAGGNLLVESVEEDKDAESVIQMSPAKRNVTRGARMLQSMNIAPPQSARTARLPTLPGVMEGTTSLNWPKVSPRPSASPPPPEIVELEAAENRRKYAQQQQKLWGRMKEGSFSPTKVSISPGRSPSQQKTLVSARAVVEDPLLRNLLPEDLGLLFRQFQALETIVSYRRRRDSNFFFLPQHNYPPCPLQLEIEQTSGRSFTLEQLSQMVTLLPEGLQLREAVRNTAQHGLKSGALVTRVPMQEEKDAIQLEKQDLSLSPQAMQEFHPPTRLRVFRQRLLDHVAQHHQIFLEKSLSDAERHEFLSSAAGQSHSSWHPAFSLNSVPPLPVSPHLIPFQQEKKPMSMEIVQNILQENPATPSRLLNLVKERLERTRESASTSTATSRSPSVSSPTTRSTPTSSKLSKHFSEAFLQKLRDRKGRSEVLASQKSDSTQRHALGRVERMSQIIVSHLNLKKKRVLRQSELLDVLHNQKFSEGDIGDLVKLLPSWCSRDSTPQIGVLYRFGPPSKLVHALQEARQAMQEKTEIKQEKGGSSPEQETPAAAAAPSQSREERE